MHHVGGDGGVKDQRGELTEKPLRNLGRHSVAWGHARACRDPSLLVARCRGGLCRGPECAAELPGLGSPLISGPGCPPARAHPRATAAPSRPQTRRGPGRRAAGWGWPVGGGDPRLRGPCDLAWLPSDPEPAAVPRHGPLLVQRGRVLPFQHSRHRQAVQVTEPPRPAVPGLVPISCGRKRGGSGSRWAC